MKFGRSCIVLICLVCLVGCSGVKLEEELVENERIMVTHDYSIETNEVIFADDLLFVSTFFIQNKLGINVETSEKIIKLSYKKNGQHSIAYFEFDNLYFSQQYIDGAEKTNLINKLSAPVRIKNDDFWIPLFAVTDSFGFNTNWMQSTSSVSIDVSNDNINPLNNQFQYEVDGDIFFLNPIERDLFYLTNKKREENKLPPLMLDIKNSEVARKKSKDLHDYGYFDHVSEQLGNPFVMLEDEGVEFIYAGENLAAGYETAEEVMNAWVESPGHKENILRLEFDRVGFGMYSGERGLKKYYTQIFTSK